MESTWYACRDKTIITRTTWEQQLLYFNIALFCNAAMTERTETACTVDCLCVRPLAFFVCVADWHTHTHTRTLRARDFEWYSLWEREILVTTKQADMGARPTHMYVKQRTQRYICICIWQCIVLPELTHTVLLLNWERTTRCHIANNGNCHHPVSELFAYNHSGATSW